MAFPQTNGHPALTEMFSRENTGISSPIWLFILPSAIAAAIPAPAKGALIGQVLSGRARQRSFISIFTATGPTLPNIAKTKRRHEHVARDHPVDRGINWNHGGHAVPQPS
ncbi:hypothetical protein LPU83_pLPU83c_0050 (plasmid) [Rhizobium favelukesii]|uniref:Uncharacterized protein n=1 Tax=Rhizobium favelukesii TaxID=348824 RepID=W6RHF9_9HYPH|nr:hypothetical protein LPU83_pLPU83c_0050 [Rhizobium favelukesii]